MNQTKGRDTSLYGHCPTCGQPATTYGFTCGHGTPAPQAEPVELPPIDADRLLSLKEIAAIRREQLLAALTENRKLRDSMKPKCPDCLSVRISHCSDPINCGGVYWPDHAYRKVVEDLDQARRELNEAWQKMDRLHNALAAKAAQVVEAALRGKG